MFGYYPAKFWGARFSVKLMKEAFDSATNAEFIRLLRYAKQPKAQSGIYVILEAANPDFIGKP